MARVPEAEAGRPEHGRGREERPFGPFVREESEAEAIRQSLTDTGLENVHVLRGPDDPEIDRCDLVVVPSEHPELGDAVRNRAKVIDFGNVLDPASRRMVSEIVDELRERKDRMLVGPETGSAAAGGGRARR